MRRFQHKHVTRIDSNHKIWKESCFNIGYMRVIATIIICMLWSSGQAQDPKLDKLEMLYDQQHFKKVYKRSEKLMRNVEEGYDQHPLPKFYRALSTFQLSLKKDRFQKFRMQALREFGEFRQLDEDGYYYQSHEHEIYEFQMRFYQLIGALYRSGKKTEAESLYKESQTLFKQQVAYDQVIKEQKVISHPKPEEMPEISSGATRRDSIMEFAKQFIGVPYKWGGNDPTGFDCSGYTKYVMKNFGVDLYRLAGDQYYKNCKKVSLSDAQVGDLVFFGPSADKVTHVGIVASNKGEPIRMIHAGSSTGITISDVQKNTYWKPLLLFVGRVVE